MIEKNWLIDKGAGWTIKVHRQFGSNIYAWSILICQHDVIKHSDNESILTDDRYLDSTDESVLEIAENQFNDYMLRGDLGTANDEASKHV